MINDMILEFNFLMRYMVEELAQELSDAVVIFCDAFVASMDIIKNNDLYGDHQSSLNCLSPTVVFLLLITHDSVFQNTCFCIHLKSPLCSLFRFRCRYRCLLRIRQV